MIDRLAGAGHAPPPLFAPAALARGRAGKFQPPYRWPAARFGLDTSSVALDMTNFATFIDTGNARAPVAQRGKAKQKRSDLRLVGLGLVVTRDGGIPLLSCQAA